MSVEAATKARGPQDGEGTCLSGMEAQIDDLVKLSVELRVSSIHKTELLLGSDNNSVPQDSKEEEEVPKSVVEKIYRELQIINYNLVSAKCAIERL